MTTIETITLAQIRALSTEAHLAGDDVVCAACNTIYAEYRSPRALDLADALEAYPEQAAIVVAAIRNAEAQA